MLMLSKNSIEYNVCIFYIDAYILFALFLCLLYIHYVCLTVYSPIVCNLEASYMHHYNPEICKKKVLNKRRVKKTILILFIFTSSNLVLHSRSVLVFFPLQSLSVSQVKTV